jgi:AcrR family transcriptional regulator
MSPTLIPRKASRQKRSKVTCDVILDAATQLLSAGGLARFNTNAVAVRAGVSIGSLYQYYPNKDAVMVALIHRSQQRQLETVAAAIASVGDASLPEKVRAIVRAAMQHHLDDPLLASAIDHEEARLPIEAELGAYLLQGGQMVRGLLILHGAEIAPIEPDHAIRTLPALVRAATDAWTNQSPPQLDRAEEEAVRAVMGYLQWNG